MIRLATDADLPALVQLHSMVQDLHAGNVPNAIKAMSDAPACLEFLRKLLVEPANCVVVAEANGSVVGYLFAQEVKREENWLRPAAHIFILEHIAVAAAHQRKGIGHKLIVRFFAEAKRRGIGRAEVVCWNFNDVATRFFQKHGFNPMHQRLTAPVS
jgi:ribosomal protein S18 acetylase RimI-like enzyme